MVSNYSVIIERKLYAYNYFITQHKNNGSFVEIYLFIYFEVVEIYLQYNDMIALVDSN